MQNEPTLNDLKKAREIVSKFAHKTPVLTSKLINERIGADLFFKCENFQKIGAFKIRGALSALFSLDECELKKGVAAASSGNHGAAVTVAANIRGVKTFIVMPNNAPKVKIDAIAGYGAEIIFCEPTVEAREKMIKKVVEETGAKLIPSYNDWNVICGQSTAAVELFEQVESLDFIVAPVGGGGLASGTCLAAKYFSSNTKIIGAEPKGADDAYRSIRDGKIYPSVNPQTIADGLLMPLGEKTFAVLSKYIHEILLVDEKSIIDAMRLVWERMKIIIEPSSAVTLAAIMGNKEKFRGKRVGLIITGGNVDLDKLPWL